MKLAVRVAGVLLVVLIMACSGGSKGSTAGDVIPDRLPVLSPDNPIELHMMLFSYSEQPDFRDNKILKKFKDELGVTLNLEIISSSQEEKMGVMIADGENYPDIINVVDVNARFVDAGAVLALDPYLTPNLANNIMDFVGPYKKRMSHVQDGKFYILPNAGRYFTDPIATVHYGPAFWIQKDVLAEAGYPILRTLDEYFGLIESYMRRHPTIDGQPTIGFAINTSESKEFCLVNPPEHLIGEPNNGGVVVIDGRAEVFAGKDYSRRYYQYLNQMNQRGLIDRESFTQNNDQYLAKLASGRVLGMFDQLWSFASAEAPLVAAGKDNRTYVPMMPVYEGYEPYYRDRPVMNVEMGIGVGVTSKKKLEAIAFINTILEEKWQKLLFWGEEGIDYSVDANGRFYLTDAQYDQRNDPVWRSKNTLMVLQDQGPKHQDTLSDGNALSYGSQPEVQQAHMTAYNRNFLAAYGKNSFGDFMNVPPDNPVYYPAWSISLPDGSAAQIAAGEVVRLQMQYYPRAIMAAPADFDGVWNTFLTELEKIDYKAYEDYVTSQLQVRINNWAD
jgi:putative aldouronate transport system substrate-binding protein